MDERFALNYLSAMKNGVENSARYIFQKKGNVDKSILDKFGEYIDGIQNYFMNPTFEVDDKFKQKLEESVASSAILLRDCGRFDLIRPLLNVMQEGQAT